jgi:spermidine synthase
VVTILPDAKGSILGKSLALPIFVGIFALSGFSGLIYESIWTHYLKLFLGHASYAQVLVLSIFMGGMAIGSAFAAKFSRKLTNLILWYGLAECIIGLLGITFHQLFTSTQAFAFENVFPNLDSPWLVHTLKWTFGALLILPQSILLGATFPLLSAGLIRRFSENSGKTLATLYFVNSLGASIGILFNTFVLIPNSGLPGSVTIAGLINIFLAVGVYYLSKGDYFPASEYKAGQQIDKSSPMRYLLIIACFTGLASFMYEIAWIRMLSMVLGASTHSFEIMLSAFILGLAIGGFWIRKKIEHFENPILVLGLIQILMGTFAVFTIPVYSFTYEMMGFAIEALNRNDSGYLLYAFFSYGISLIVMLPVTVCAGTTLPLVTYILLKKRTGESAIGNVYAWNTIGGIAGIMVAVHLIMPNLGLKWVIITGASVDLFLGCFIIYHLQKPISKSGLIYFLTSFCLISFVFLSMTNFDRKLMVSGVFRYGLEKNTFGKVIFYKDGKTSSVAVNEYGNSRVLINNGKPDAGVTITATKDNDKTGTVTEPTNDESTMVLVGTLPYVYKSQINHIANIGLGSGLTAHTLLHNKHIERVDSIEIEQAVVQAAQYFRPNVENIFTDPRSHIVIEDAKTYFAVSGNKYDVIISEPSNPWVSGVAGLFSTEFYYDVKRHLSDGGIFLQWLQTYEITPELVATVYMAIKENFSDIHFYQVSVADIAIVAANSPLNANYERPFEIEGLKNELSKLKILGPLDLAFRKLAGKDKLDLIFAPILTAPNSDYFPILDIGAAKARFKGVNADSLYQMHLTTAIDRLVNDIQPDYSTITEDPNIGLTKLALQNTQFIDRLTYFMSIDSPVLIETEVDHRAKKLAELFKYCSEKGTSTVNNTGSNQFVEESLWVSHFLEADKQRTILEMAESCHAIFDEKARLWADVQLAWLTNEFSTVISLTDEYFSNQESLTTKLDRQLLIFSLASRAATSNLASVQSLYEKMAPEFFLNMELIGLFHLLGSSPTLSDFQGG